MMLKSVLALIVLLSVSLNADAQSCGPQRIRKDIKNLSSNERAALSRALNALYRNGSIKRFVDMHVQMSSVSHNVPEFLARHRVMLKLFEDELVGASEGGLTGLPYWDSTQDARNPRNSVVLTAAYMGSAANGCIREGPASGWTEDNGRCVERGKIVIFFDLANFVFMTDILTHMVY
ncbi:hypothetical protein BKA69DRAFT_1094738 [Paraphysoderma sedebokerense]|nr:hypothetical protein BKA69DRAFT_1094738 [Paraphysoderma sedebokerense]